MRFDERARSWVEAMVGAKVVDVRRVEGGVASVIDRVTTLDDEGRQRHLILRRVPPQPDVADHNPTGEIARETAALQRLLPSRLSPVLLAADPLGLQCGVPASLQTMLPGFPIVSSQDPLSWVWSLAASRLEVAELSASCDGLDVFVPWTAAQSRPPSWSTVPSSWELAIEALDRVPPGGPPQLVHRDFHPGNVLFREGIVTGIVDWVHACRGPIEVDVSRCRVEIALLAGIGAADAFLDAFGEAAAGYHPLWDALVAIELAPWLEQLLTFNLLGARLTLAGLQASLDELVQRASTAV